MKKTLVYVENPVYKWNYKSKEKNIDYLIKISYNSNNNTILMG